MTWSGSAGGPANSWNQFHVDDFKDQTMLLWLLWPNYIVSWPEARYAQIGTSMKLLFFFLFHSLWWGHPVLLLHVGDVGPQPPHPFPESNARVFISNAMLAEKQIQGDLGNPYITIVYYTVWYSMHLRTIFPHPKQRDLTTCQGAGHGFASSRIHDTSNIFCISWGVVARKSTPAWIEVECWASSVNDCTFHCCRKSMI